MQLFLKCNLLNAIQNKKLKKLIINDIYIKSPILKKKMLPCIPIYGIEDMA